jgi:hypothetical protein
MSAPSLYQFVKSESERLGSGSVGLQATAELMLDGGFRLRLTAMDGATSETFLLWPDPFITTADMIANERNVPEPDMKTFLAKLRTRQHAETLDGLRELSDPPIPRTPPPPEFCVVVSTSPTEHELLHCGCKACIKRYSQL